MGKARSFARRLMPEVGGSGFAGGQDLSPHVRSLEPRVSSVMEQAGLKQQRIALWFSVRGENAIAELMVSVPVIHAMLSHVEDPVIRHGMRQSTITGQLSNRADAICDNELWYSGDVITAPEKGEVQPSFWLQVIPISDGKGMSVRSVILVISHVGFVHNDGVQVATTSGLVMIGSTTGDDRGLQYWWPPMFVAYGQKEGDAGLGLPSGWQTRLSHVERLLSHVNL
ncbi:hypothetical protein NE237_021203 [Protea cynaroides]|uniref:Uncharacterized protein n=1 Tax=Protea cynaroides TaxID=273540 RepID=A0A9Q0K4N0_9MAGN|nr:hypothetical protein NE237_021203 [Protea cynaroides]